MRAALARSALAGLALVALAGAGIPPGERRSDTEALSADTRAMQADDAANPGMFAVAEGEELWARREGDGRACADCHGPPTAMRGVAARYPAWDAPSRAPVDLGARVNLCRVRHQGAAPFAPESAPLLALTALIGNVCRGVPIAPPDDAGMRESRARGRALFTRRMGQLNLACAACHDESWGRRLAGSPIPQGHPVGYPEYRLEWQATGSLQRRLRGCLTGVRAEPFPFGAPELVDLEAYLMERAAGLPIETPAVRP